jgi:Spy/CpxP family protein refolding chaperone
LSNRELSSWGVKLIATALLLAVFVAGAVSGAVFYRWARLDEPGERVPLPPGDLGRMLHELNLTSEQRTKMKAVFERHRPKLDAVLRETFPKVRAVQDEIDAELETLLTAEQRQRFTDMRKRRPPPGAPMGPGGFGPPGRGNERPGMGPGDGMPPPPDMMLPPLPSSERVP